MQSIAVNRMVIESGNRRVLDVVMPMCETGEFLGGDLTAHQSVENLLRVDVGVGTGEEVGVRGVLVPTANTRYDIEPCEINTSTLG